MGMVFEYAVCGAETWKCLQTAFLDISQFCCSTLDCYWKSLKRVLAEMSVPNYPLVFHVHYKGYGIYRILTLL